jgi:uncharacterized protein
MLDVILLRIAKSAILSKLDDFYSFDEKKLLDDYPFLKQDGAAFVTLSHDHQLRGCIGSIVAYRTLLEDIIHNALSAAFRDPRFTPLSQNELDELTLEVSLLSEPEPLEYTDYDDLLRKVVPNVDGLILKHGSFQGTFLPQVWEQLPSAKQFLEHLSVKAGANPSIYEAHPSIYRYRVEHIEDKFINIQAL